MERAWDGAIEAPVKGRSEKPRTTGLTMVIDKGIGLYQLEDLVRSSGLYIDIIKLTFGTSVFYDKEFLIKKNNMARNAGIDIMPGGTFLEVAVWKGVLNKYLARAKELGFSTIEVSDGTIDMSLETRKEAIQQALDNGFRVITEVGKKDPSEALPAAKLHEMIASDAESGAFKVIIEAREAGKGVGIFDQQGKVIESEVEGILEGVDDKDRLIWEAPMKNQQQALIIRFGPNVSLGNIPPGEILALEALRQGLRGDTLKRAYLSDKE